MNWATRERVICHRHMKRNTEISVLLGLASVEAHSLPDSVLNSCAKCHWVVPVNIKDNVNITPVLQSRTARAQEVYYCGQSHTVHCEWRHQVQITSLLILLESHSKAHSLSFPAILPPNWILLKIFINVICGGRPHHLWQVRLWGATLKDWGVNDDHIHIPWNEPPGDTCKDESVVLERKQRNKEAEIKGHWLGGASWSLWECRSPICLLLQLS